MTTAALLCYYYNWGFGRYLHVAQTLLKHKKHIYCYLQKTVETMCRPVPVYMQMKRLLLVPTHVCVCIHIEYIYILCDQSRK
jgi:hypothetical protein